MTPAGSRQLAEIQAGLSRLVRYDDEFGTWRYCEQALIPLRPRMRQVARALLVHPRHLPYEVAAAIADGGGLG